MSISPVSTSAPSAVQANNIAKVTPFRRDRDGDYDNNRVETKQSEAAEAAKGGQILNVKA
jgi:hypothetical protein